MKISTRKILFTVFFFSGFCALLYQVIWVRLAYASFGIITPVLSVVISVFMLGLAIGSWGVGRWIKGWTSRARISAIYFYALAELLIGVGAFAVPWMFALGERLLLPMGETDSGHYLLVSALVIAASLLGWCILMGASFPLALAFEKEQTRSSESNFSFLYLANVIGAMCGTILTTVVLIEWLGFKSTLMVAATANFLIALVAVWLGIRHPLRSPAEIPDQRKSTAAAAQPSAGGSMLLYAVLFTTGFCSMALEVVWIRAFIPILRTSVYAFGAILFIYLLSTWIGSYFYRRNLAGSKLASNVALLAALSVAVLLPVVVNDPRIHRGVPWILLSIAPFCTLLGYLTPRIIDDMSHGAPDLVGRAYAVNLAGCILGPLFAAYLLLPATGARISMVILALPFLFLWILFLRSWSGRKTLTATTGILLCCTLLVSIRYSKSYEEGAGLLDQKVRRDHTATVITGTEIIDENNYAKTLLVNGVTITMVTPITKVMAHLPLGLLPKKPESALVICFGMGTTFRSAMSWGIDTTAVELVPSVRDAFGDFFADAAELMQDPRGHIIVDDGRRYLMRTEKTFDVITIDPPPPVETAGSSLLYSTEFYDLMKKHLKPGGMVQQWHPGDREESFQAVARSLVESFPYVAAFYSMENWGTHFIASMSPIVIPPVDVFISRLPEGAKKDLLEWEWEQEPIETYVANILFRRLNLDELLNPDREILISDDRPFNEYFVLRRYFPR